MDLYKTNLPSRVFLDALELLEAYRYHSTTFAPFNWEWVFETTVPWLATAIVLTELTEGTEQSEKDRAQLQIENIFQRFSDPSAPVSSTPMWKLLVQLRQHMQDVPGQHNAPVTSVIGSSGPSLASKAGASTLEFMDDLMLDYGNSEAGLEDIVYNNQFMLQDAQEFPW